MAAKTKRPYTRKKPHPLTKEKAFAPYGIRPTDDVTPLFEQIAQMRMQLEFEHLRSELSRLQNRTGQDPIIDARLKMEEDCAIQKAQQQADKDRTTLDKLQADDRMTFATGATRCAGVAGDEGSFPLRYDLIFGNIDAIKRIARTYGEGSLKYAPNNWKKGFPESVLFNHAMAHLVQYAEGDTSEDHLAHAAWNLLTLMHQQTHHPELMDMTNPEAPKEP